MSDGPTVSRADAGSECQPDLSSVPALVLAGGRGQRLRPFTATFPKPLMPVGDRTILEILLRRLQDHGVRKVTLAVNHLAPLVRAYFGNGEGVSLDLTYLHEDQPLGTAGPLGGLEGVDSTLLVMNGDLLTDIDFRAFIAAHRRSRAALSVATIVERFQLESGVVEVDEEGRVSGFREKPVSHHRICIGIYAVEPRARALVTPNQHLDMPDLIVRLVNDGENVVAYDHMGTWIDIGRPDDLARAQQFVESLQADEAPAGWLRT